MGFAGLAGLLRDNARCAVERRGPRGTVGVNGDRFPEVDCGMRPPMIFLALTGRLSEGRNTKHGGGLRFGSSEVELWRRKARTIALTELHSARS